MKKKIVSNNTALFSILITLIVILSSFLFCYILLQNNKLKNDLELKTLEVDNLNTTIYELRQKNSELLRKNFKYSLQTIFMDKYVAICPADGTSLYHKFNCSHYDSSDSFLILNIPSAKSQGYSPCYYCESDSTFQNSNNEIVYVTDTGSRYHRSWCSYLKSSNAITKQKAIEQGYSACSICNP